MAIKQTQKFCKGCQENVLATKNGPNHILHLILSLITAGIWVIPWVLFSVLQQPWRCSKCGKRLQL
jgi:hypothetical protein